MRAGLRALAGLTALYVAAGALAFALETTLIFHPPPGALADCAARAGVRHVRIGAEQALLLETGAPRLAVIYHGNAQNACDLAPVAAALSGDHDILLPEYPGYGGDKRRPGREAIAGMVAAVGDWAAARYGDVTPVGYSIGTGAAALHAGRADIARVILIAPFDRLYDLAFSKGFVFPRRLFRTDFDNAAALASGGAEVTIILGETDRVIPPRHARSLAARSAAAGREVEIVALPGRGHAGAFDLGMLSEALRRDGAD